MIVLIVFIVFLETVQFHVVLAFYVSKTKLTCMHIQAKLSGQKKNNNKNTERRAGLRFDCIHKSSIILKDSPIIQKRKLKKTYFLLKQQVWGRGSFTVSGNFSQEFQFDLPHIKLYYIIFHAALIHLLKIDFQVQYYW